MDTGQAAAEDVAKKYEHLSLLINAAGILHIPGVLSPGAVMWLTLLTLRSLLPVDSFLQGKPTNAETALARLDSSSLHRVFEVNAFGPILVSKVTTINTI